ncbi:hypothetical protein DUNSADRAFT_8647 [Dunaliella salina]|uniref:Encoded protein n=1 Tax=Dunaliella salina TaxID=3046 RepID=A0ABQ7GJ69_DUNSA|nr:hypothetical protein DUNSADRAFT_8647 [Dunaliella salina]|eukprot:KAF5834639.1 hypothetical protein DUNSADRAFT_8647 [Dunaliella salina]
MLKRAAAQLGEYSCASLLKRLEAEWLLLKSIRQSACARSLRVSHPICPARAPHELSSPAAANPSWSPNSPLQVSQECTPTPPSAALAPASPPDLTPHTANGNGGQSQTQAQHLQSAPHQTGEVCTQLGCVGEVVAEIRLVGPSNGKSTAAAGTVCGGGKDCSGCSRECCHHTANLCSSTGHASKCATKALDSSCAAAAASTPAPCGTGAAAAIDIPPFPMSGEHAAQPSPVSILKHAARHARRARGVVFSPQLVMGPKAGYTHSD